jgi:hypothetical protein
MVSGVSFLIIRIPPQRPLRLCGKTFFAAETLRSQSFFAFRFFRMLTLSFTFSFTFTKSFSLFDKASKIEL